MQTTGPLTSVTAPRAMKSVAVFARALGITLASYSVSYGEDDREACVKLRQQVKDLGRKGNSCQADSDCVCLQSPCGFDGAINKSYAEEYRSTLHRYREQCPGIYLGSFALGETPKCSNGECRVGP